MIVGLTGGVATGKSLVADELKRLGAEVIDADAISREITVKGSPAYDDILKEFGPGVIDADGLIDRKALGRIVFSDPTKLARLNALTHPRIRERIREQTEALKKRPGNPIIVISAALLIEGGLYKEMDLVVVVSASVDLQVERLASRDGRDKFEALKIIDAQMPTEKKAELADYVVDNSGTVASAIERTRELYERLKGAGPGKSS